MKSPSMLRAPPPTRRRYLLAAIILFFIISMSGLTNLDRTESNLRYAIQLGVDIVSPDRDAPTGPVSCQDDVRYVDRKRYNLTSEIKFQRKCIRAVEADPSVRSEVANITNPLLGKSRILHQYDSICDGWMGEDEPICDTYELQVGSPYPFERHPNMLFGVATTIKRLNESIDQFAHWLSKSGAPLLAVAVDDKENDEKVDTAQFEPLKKLYHERGMNLILVNALPELGPNEQHFTMLRDLLHHSTPYTQWISIIDDDTFFPSLYSVSEALSKFNPKLPQYLGGLTESGDAIIKHGTMAYGGAGVFLSVPLVAQLEPQIETCLEKSEVDQGDGLLSECITTHTKAEFTAIKGLHQVDMAGDCSGFYESGTLPLSLHHWKSWHEAPVDKMAKSANFCGSCFLQRWRFGSDTVLSNGYSISMYKDGLENLPLDEMEATWEGAYAMEWGLGTLRQPIAENLKKSYTLIDSEQVGNKMRQVYVHQTEDTWGRDEVVELLWQWQ